MYKITAGVSLFLTILSVVFAVAAMSIGDFLLSVLVAVAGVAAAINFVDDLVKAIHSKPPTSFDNDDGSSDYD